MLGKCGGAASVDRPQISVKKKENYKKLISTLGTLCFTSS